MGGQHLQVFACHAGSARVHADSILEKHAHIFRYPAHDPVNQRLGTHIGIVIGADPQRTRQLVENLGEKTGRSPGRIDFDREVPAGNPQWQRCDRRFQGIGLHCQIRETGAGLGLVMHAGQAENQLLRPGLGRDALPVREVAAHGGQVSAGHQAQIVHGRPLHQQAADAQTLP
jgi:hypothetical protein